VPHYQQAAFDDRDVQVDKYGFDHDNDDFTFDDDDARYENDVRPRRRRRLRGYPEGYGQTVRRILHSLAQATLDSVYYKALPRPMMIIHPRLHYEPLPLPPRGATVYCHENDHHLGWARTTRRGHSNPSSIGSRRWWRRRANRSYHGPLVKGDGSGGMRGDPPPHGCHTTHCKSCAIWKYKSPTDTTVCTAPIWSRECCAIRTIP
jgi:hypothetical protein